MPINRKIAIIALIITFLAIAIWVSVYASYTLNQSGNQTNQNAPTPTSTNNISPAVPPSMTPTPHQTTNPTASAQRPELTPVPTSLLPSDCRISYAESRRTYDSSTNITAVSFYVVFVPDFSSRGTYYLYPARFVLKENGNVVSLVDPHSTSDGIGLSENNRVTVPVLIVQVPGNYTSNNYELGYYNPPADIIFVWTKSAN